MNKRVSDVFKGTLIFMIAGAVFSLVFLEYKMVASGIRKFNTITDKLSANSALVEKGR